MGILINQLITADPSATRGQIMKNVDYKIQVLEENYNNYIESGEDTISLREYVELEAYSDPGFFRWLFDDGELGDFDYGMSEEQQEEYEKFLEEL